MPSFGFMAIIVMAGSAAAQDSGGRFNEYPDTTLKGFVTAELTKADADKCRHICEQRSGCAGFDIRAESRTCRLFGQISSGESEMGSAAETRQRVPGYRAPSNAAVEAPPVPAGPTQSTWTHNGSVMSLRVNPSADGRSRVTITYDTPKPELSKVGIRHGTTLFEGQLDGSSLTGKARLTGKCGIIQYDVSGLFDTQSATSFYLRGASPKRGDDCTIQRWDSTGSNANLRFDPN
ncbi:PAN domain-containing protein [Rhizobium sp. BK176]|uniref:PAN domain-containing protein n=1 Tax=Rhizobium sp. BK176 TaxID=2587071 RepID=UPI002166CD06|nr:PAN domain-containing protein [Rhizobium sp. BK176]MCS4090049.1 hypothetical protein [Rhizobium sp. BK176]